MVAEVKSRYHSSWLPKGVIAVDPYRINGGVRAVIDLTELVDVSYYAGISGGAMFIAYPSDEALVFGQWVYYGKDYCSSKTIVSFCR